VAYYNYTPLNSGPKKDVMTGKEKMQAIINEIHKAHEELISGNKIRLYSGSFSGISLEEQKQVLEILANDEKVIKYTSEDAYETEDDIDPETKINIQEESMMDGLAERYMIEQLMESQWYDIEVLDSFEAPVSEPQHQEDITRDQQAADIPDWIKLTLSPSDYDKPSGSLRLAPHIIVQISKRGTSKNKDGKKYLECLVMERVFKTVNTLKTGITFSKILTLHDDKIGTTEERKVRNAVDAINKKITASKGPERLLRIQNRKVFVHNSYL
jgi:hypothetical protein